MLFYFILFLVVLLIGLSKFKYKNVLIIIILFIVHAIRFDIGFDFPSYYNIVDGYISNKIVFLRLGPITGGIAYISHYYDFTQLFFIITSFIFFLFFYLTVRDFSDDYLLSILVFLAFPFLYISSFCFIKQFLSLSIIFFASRYIIEKKPIKYFICVVIASLFHISSILCFILYFFRYIKLNIIVFYGLLVTSFILFPLISDGIFLIFPQYSYYIDLDNIVKGGAGIQVLLNVLIVIIHFILKRKKYEVNSEIYFNIVLFGVLLFNALMPIGPTGTRVATTYLIFLVLLLPKAFYFKYYNYKYLFIVFICFILFMLSLFMGAKPGTRSPTVPYQTFFGKTINDLRPYGSTIDSIPWL